VSGVPACTVCHQPIEDMPFTDAETGAAFHLRCLADRGLDELVAASLLTAGAVLLAVAVVWAC
jgi:hypothetical protein